MATGTFPIVYDVILFLAVAVASWIVIVTWRWRRVPGSKSLMMLVIGEGFWTLCYALHLSAFYRPEPNFWLKLMFLGVVMVPGSALVWSARYSKQDGWVNKRNVALLFIEPILFNIVIWTDPWHGWYSGNYQTTGMLGIGFRLHSLYSYIILIIGGIMLVINWIQTPAAYKRQALLVLLAFPIATLANLITILQLTSVKYIDFSPLGLFAAGAIFTYAQLRHRLFDLLPVARHSVVEGMRDGVIVLDKENRIIDMNPAAQQMTMKSIKESLGLMARTALPVWEEIEKQVLEKKDVNIEFFMEGKENRNIGLTMTVLHDKRSQPGGKLIILRDVTHVKSIEAALRESNNNLLQKLQEIEALQKKLQQEAIHDPLTGLYNRRFLEETLNRELAQADRSHEPMSLAMIDLDRFKNINDSYGHNVGDLFLVALGEMLQKKLRGGDVACRFGGEEFVVVMPGAPLEQAAERVNQFRQAFAALKITAGDHLLSATFSAGVAGYPLHGKDDKSLIAASDHALYAAKEAGRNRVIVAQKVFD